MGSQVEATSGPPLGRSSEQCIETLWGLTKNVKPILIYNVLIYASHCRARLTTGEALAGLCILYISEGFGALVTAGSAGFDSQVVKLFP